MRDTTQNRFKQAAAVVVALTVILSVVGTVGMVTAQEVTGVEQSESEVTASPGETVTLTTTLTISDLNAHALQVFLPSEWEGTITDADGGAAKPPEGSGNPLEVVWLTLESSHEVTYDIDVPEDADAGTYTVDVDGSGIDPADGSRVVESTQTTITVVEDAPPAPANFQVSNPNVPSPVTRGETATVSATVENTGDEAGTQTVTASVAGSQIGSDDVTLAGGASDTVSFDVDTSGLSTGANEVVISSDDDSATGSMVVEADDQEENAVDVSLDPASETVTTGEQTTFDIVVSDVDGGVGAIDLTVSSSDASSVEIVDIDSMAAIDTEDTVVAGDGSSASIDAFGLDTADSGSVVVATVTVEGIAPGTADLSVDVTAVGSESAQSYQIGETDGAAVTVIALPALDDTYAGPPQDLDGDGVYEDINGDGVVDASDVQALFVNRDAPAVTQNGSLFDLNGDGTFDIVDVQALFNEVYN